MLGATRLVAAQGEGRGKEKDKGQGKANGKHKHHDGAKMLGERIKGNGKHVIEKNGPHTVSLDVKHGKIAGMHARHVTKGKPCGSVLRSTPGRTTRPRRRDGGVDGVARACRSAPGCV